jgi:hypothetical protein
MAPIVLEAIAFNHDPASHERDALNLRWNAALPMVVPEWQRGLNVRPEDSVAAYSIREASTGTITVRARFSTTLPGLRQAEVRAVLEPSFAVYPWNLTSNNTLLPLAIEPQLLSALLYGHHWATAQVPAESQLGSVLGPLAARDVEFGADGQTDFETFELAEHALARHGVGIHLLNWWWQYRLAGDPAWTTFALSQHTIYTLLAAPRAPWEQQGAPHNTQLPWVDVLNVACRWARGATTEVRVAARITQAVYLLGPELFEYNCPNFGSPVYTSLDFASGPDSFNCSAFLERLNGGFGRGPYLNCSDCAAIVSTFANSVGCDLWQSRMGGLVGGFSIHPIVAIGASQWAQPCGWWPGFGMHEVAWTGNCGNDDTVFDACLVFDADINPAHAPFSGIFPANIRFGQAGEGGYRDRLARRDARADCPPQPSTRQRRYII